MQEGVGDEGGTTHDGNLRALRTQHLLRERGHCRVGELLVSTARSLQHEPQLWIPTIREFTPVWNAHSYALAVMGPEMYEQLEKSGLPMQFIARDTERVFVRTPPR